MKRTPIKQVSDKQRKINREIAVWAEAVKDRDDRWCQGPARGLPGQCWGGIEAHHINRDRGDNRLENGVTLCPYHHTTGGRESVHGNPALAYELGLLVHSWDHNEEAS